MYVGDSGKGTWVRPHDESASYSQERYEGSRGASKGCDEGKEAKWKCTERYTKGERSTKGFPGGGPSKEIAILQGGRRSLWVREIATKPSALTGSEGRACAE